MKKEKLFIKKHILVPDHIKLTEKEKQEVLAKYNVTVNELPKINLEDPAIAKLNVKTGDVIKIVRQSQTAGRAVFYRGVSSE